MGECLFFHVLFTSINYSIDFYRPPSVYLHDMSQKTQDWPVENWKQWQLPCPQASFKVRGLLKMGKADELIILNFLCTTIHVKHEDYLLKPGVYHCKTSLHTYSIGVMIEQKLEFDL